MKLINYYTSALSCQPQTAGDESFSIIQYTDRDTQYVAVQNNEDTFFAGHTTNGVLSNWIMGEIPQRIVDLAINAINNRTKERNFSRLGEKLALGEISEAEYDSLLQENEDEYVIKCNIKPSELDLKYAVLLAPKVMDVNDTDDLAVLFSFDESEIRRYLEK